MCADNSIVSKKICGSNLEQLLVFKALRRDDPRVEHLPRHCESGNELWLQGEPALQTQSFRDAEPQLIIPPKRNTNHGVLPVQLRPGIHISLTTTDPCVPIISWKCNDAYCFWSSQLVPSNPTGKSFLFICLSLAVWLCLKKCCENWVLMVLLQIGAKDLTVTRGQSKSLIRKNSLFLSLHEVSPRVG